METHKIAHHALKVSESSKCLSHMDTILKTNYQRAILTACLSMSGVNFVLLSTENQAQQPESLQLPVSHQNFLPLVVLKILLIIIVVVGS